MFVHIPNIERRSSRFEVKEADSHKLIEIYRRERSIYEKATASANLSYSSLPCIFLCLLFGILLGSAIVFSMPNIDQMQIKIFFSLFIGGSIATIPYLIIITLKGDKIAKDFYHNHNMTNISNSEFDSLSRIYKLFYSSDLPFYKDPNNENGYSVRFRLLERTINKLNRDAIIKSE